MVNKKKINENNMYIWHLDNLGNETPLTRFQETISDKNKKQDKKTKNNKDNNKSSKNDNENQDKNIYPRGGPRGDNPDKIFFKNRIHFWII